MNGGPDAHEQREDAAGDEVDGAALIGGSVPEGFGIGGSGFEEPVGDPGGI